MFTVAALPGVCARQMSQVNRFRSASTSFSSIAATVTAAGGMAYTTAPVALSEVCRMPPRAN